MAQGPYTAGRATETLSTGTPNKDAGVTPSDRLRRHSPARLRIPARDSLFWLVVLPIAALATTSLVMWVLGIPGGDDPAHLYKVAQLRQGESTLWDNFWYAGSYGAITYGILFYWLARWVPIVVLVVLSTGLLPLLFHLYLRRRWGITGRAAAWALAAVLVVYLAMGQSPFLVALCLIMGGLVLLSSGRRVTAALLWSAAVFINPLAIVAGGIFVLGDVAAHRDARRDALVFAVALLPAVAARVVIGLLFAAPALEFHDLSILARLLVYAAVGVLLARASTIPSRRALQWVFAAFAVVVLPTFLLTALPVGSNVGRFFSVFGVPLLIAAAWPTRLPRWVPAILVVAALALQMQFPLWQLGSERTWATQPSFFTPALAVATRFYDPDYRFHVVVPEGHWEAFYFPSAGYPITRGWFRQDDALHNLVLYDPELTTTDYRHWLRQMAVRYVFVPNAPLVPTAWREVTLLESSACFDLVFKDASWTVYRQRRTKPIVEPLSPRAQAEVLWLDHTTMRFQVSRAGRYRIRVTDSPYWVLVPTTATATRSHRHPSWHVGGVLRRSADTSASLRRDAHGMLLLRAPAKGSYTLSFDVGRTLTARLESMRP